MINIQSILIFNQSINKKSYYVLNPIFVFINNILFKNIRYLT